MAYSNGTEAIGAWSLWVPSYACRHRRCPDHSTLLFQPPSLLLPRVPSRCAPCYCSAPLCHDCRILLLNSDKGLSVPPP